MRMRGASTYQKELYAIMEAVQKWRQYLLPRFFIIRTDHSSIKELLQQVVQTPEQQIYVRKLLGYNFRIEYKPGYANNVADVLSRVHEEDTPANGVALFALITSFPIPEFLSSLKAENGKLMELVELHRRFGADELGDEYGLRDGMLLFKNQYYIGA